MSVFTREKFDLSSDALLISSGMYAAAASVSLPLWWWASGRNIDPATPGAGVIEDAGLAWILVAFMLILGLYVGPAIAWALHGRKQRLRLVVAPIVSPVVIFFIALLGEPFAALYQGWLTPLTTWEYAGPALAFAVLGAVHLGLVLYALLRIPARSGDSQLLRGARLAAFVALALLTLIIGAAYANGYDATVVQALLVILGIGYAAGLTTHMAAVIDEY